MPNDEYMKWLHETHPEYLMIRTVSVNENDTPGDANNGAQIIPEKVLLFQQRFAEEYDFLDEKYT